MMPDLLDEAARRRGVEAAVAAFAAAADSRRLKPAARLRVLLLGLREWCDASGLDFAEAAGAANDIADMHASSGVRGRR